MLFFQPSQFAFPMPFYLGEHSVPACVRARVARARAVLGDPLRRVQLAALAALLALAAAAVAFGYRYVSKTPRDAAAYATFRVAAPSMDHAQYVAQLGAFFADGGLARFDEMTGLLARLGEKKEWPRAAFTMYYSSLHCTIVSAANGTSSPCGARGNNNTPRALYLLAHGMGAEIEALLHGAYDARAAQVRTEHAACVADVPLWRGSYGVGAAARLLCVLCFGGLGLKVLQAGEELASTPSCDESPADDDDDDDEENGNTRRPRPRVCGVPLSIFAELVALLAQLPFCAYYLARLTSTTSAHWAFLSHHLPPLGYTVARLPGGLALAYTYGLLAVVQGVVAVTVFCALQGALPRLRRRVVGARRAQLERLVAEQAAREAERVAALKRDALEG